jgi:hypothetical protein
MTPKLTPQELEAINREASDYAWIHYNEDNDDWSCIKKSYAAALTSERLKHKAEIQAYKDFITLKDEYIQLLTDELSDMAGMAYVHGWRSPRVEKGKELREKISQFKL